MHTRFSVNGRMAINTCCAKLIPVVIPNLIPIMFQIHQTQEHACYYSYLLHDTILFLIYSIVSYSFIALKEGLWEGIRQVRTK